MVFDVIVTRKALADIDEHVLYITQNSVEEASKWKDRLELLIQSFAEMPRRFSVIEESRRLKHPYRSAIHYSQRVIFRIEESTRTVIVVRVYHGSRRPLTQKEV